MTNVRQNRLVKKFGTGNAVVSADMREVPIKG